MRFTVSTKPLADALSLAIINANVSDYFKQSCVAQIQAYGDTLQINLEASQLCSQVKMKGTSYGSDERASILVSSLTFKALIQSFDSPTVTFEFIDDNHGLVLHSGKSKFTLAETSEYDRDLKTPSEISDMSKSADISIADWTFVKNHQVYAVSMSYVHPAYTRIYVRDTGEVLAGDADLGIFTYSKKSNLGVSCLLQTSIVNLLTALPEGAKLIDAGDSYILVVNTDGYEFRAEMVPESEEIVGSYNYDIVMSTFEKDERMGSSFDVAYVYKFVKQAELLSTSSEASLDIHVDSHTIKIEGDDVDCELETQNAITEPYTVKVPSKLFKDVINNLDADSAIMYPYTSGGVIKGVIFCTDNMSAVLAAVE